MKVALWVAVVVVVIFSVWAAVQIERTNRSMEHKAMRGNGLEVPVGS